MEIAARVAFYLEGTDRSDKRNPVELGSVWAKLLLFRIRILDSLTCFIYQVGVESCHLQAKALKPSLLACFQTLDKKKSKVELHLERMPRILVKAHNQPAGGAG